MLLYSAWVFIAFVEFGSWVFCPISWYFAALVFEGRKKKKEGGVTRWKFGVFSA